MQANLWEHYPVGNLTDPESKDFTFGKYFFALKNSLNPNYGKYTIPEISKSFKDFYYWLDKHGIDYTKVAYPTYFNTREGLQYPGMLANKDIAMHESFITIPKELLMSPSKAFNSNIKSIFTDHPEIFAKCEVFAIWIGDVSNWIMFPEIGLH